MNKFVEKTPEGPPFLGRTLRLTVGFMFACVLRMQIERRYQFSPLMARAASLFSIRIRPFERSPGSFKWQTRKFGQESFSLGYMAH